MKIAATGDCYEAAGKLFMDSTIFGSNTTMRLVHGEVTGQGPLEGTKFGHAWVEDGGTVIDKSNGRDVRMSKADYYELGRIGSNVIKYDLKKFRKKIVDSGHWGPWDLKTESGL